MYKDEIPVIDGNEEEQLIEVESTDQLSPRLKPTQNLSAAEELQQLVEGDASQNSIMNDLVTAKGQASAANTNTVAVPQDIDSFAKEIINTSGVQIKNPVVIKRFGLVLKSYVNKVRTLPQVKKFMTKKIQFGGMGLPEDSIDKLLKALKQKEGGEPEIQIPAEKLEVKTPLTKPVSLEKKEIKNNKKENGFFSEMVNQIRTEKVQDVGPTEEAAAIEPVRQAQSKENKNLVKKESEELITAKDAVIPFTHTRKQEKKNIPHPEKIQGTGLAKTATKIPNETLRRNTVEKTESLGKPMEKTLRQTQDNKQEVPKENAKPVKNKTAAKPIGYSNMLIGPVDELRYSIIDFRRLAMNPEDRVKKIQAKVNLLEEESFSNKYLGIRSWMSSEVVETYIKLGQKSLEARVPLEQVITENLKGDSKGLSMEEFETISQINELIRR